MAVFRPTVTPAQTGSTNQLIGSSPTSSPNIKHTRHPPHNCRFDAGVLLAAYYSICFTTFAFFESFDSCLETSIIILSTPLTIDLRYSSFIITLCEIAPPLCKDFLYSELLIVLSFIALDLFSKIIGEKRVIELRIKVMFSFLPNKSIALANDGNINWASDTFLCRRHPSF